MTASLKMPRPDSEARFRPAAKEFAPSACQLGVAGVDGLRVERNTPGTQAGDCDESGAIFDLQQQVLAFLCGHLFLSVQSMPGFRPVGMTCTERDPAGKYSVWVSRSKAVATWRE